MRTGDTRNPPESTPGPGSGSGSGSGCRTRSRTHDRSGESASRRWFLRGLVAGAGVAGLAGCVGGLSDAGERPFGENPVAEAVGSRPRLGPPRAQTAITLVSFDDPSCPSCSSLHHGAFERIESEWVAEGRATVYSRAYYFVHDWARSAVNALLETHERDPTAYWDLKAAYYEHQDELDEGNVVERTGDLLEEIGAAVDPEPVRTAARERTHESAIAADDEAAEAAGIDGVPTVFVFREGEFVTTLGDDRFDAYESAVESRA